MDDIRILHLIIALVVGVAVGLFYFGGLWFTIKRATTSRRPHLLMFGSLIVRALISAGTIFLVGREYLPALVVVMVGFLATRSVLVRRIGNLSMCCRTTDVTDDADNLDNMCDRNDTGTWNDMGTADTQNDTDNVDNPDTQDDADAEGEERE